MNAAGQDHEFCLSLANHRLFQNDPSTILCKFLFAFTLGLSNALTGNACCKVAWCSDSFLIVQQNDLLHELCTQVMKGNPSPAGCRESGMSCKQTKPRKESQSGFWGWILFDSGYTDQSYRCHHLSLHLQGDKYCPSGSRHLEYGCVEYGILLQAGLSPAAWSAHTCGPVRPAWLPCRPWCICCMETQRVTQQGRLCHQAAGQAGAQPSTQLSPRCPTQLSPLTGRQWQDLAPSRPSTPALSPSPALCC